MQEYIALAHTAVQPQYLEAGRMIDELVRMGYSLP